MSSSDGVLDPMLIDGSTSVIPSQIGSFVIACLSSFALLWTPCLVLFRSCIVLYSYPFSGEPSTPVATASGLDASFSYAREASRQSEMNIDGRLICVEIFQIEDQNDRLFPIRPLSWKSPTLCCAVAIRLGDNRLLRPWVTLGMETKLQRRVCRVALQANVKKITEGTTERHDW